jgi:hypothetical protein
MPNCWRVCSNSVPAWRHGQLRRRLEVHAHEEQARGVVAFEVAELLRIDDVAAGLVQQARDGVHDALGIGAGQGQDKLVGLWHRCNCRERAAMGGESGPSL